ncbi:MAG: glycosyltransferase family 1 protein [Deltaproteobacteria bacterium]|nr:glycosyltransferase family 1 protein [Deltaproteobacteria bacterium]
MRICLDVRGNHFGGVLTYSYSILKQFSEINTEHEFVLLLDEYQFKKNLFIIKDLKKIVVPVMNPLKILLWNNWVLPKIIRDHNINVYHGFKHFTLRDTCAKVIFTLHTASWWLYPELFKKKELFFWRNYYNFGIQSSNLIITNSIADKKLLLETHRISSSKVKTIHLAPEIRFSKISDHKILKNTKEKYRLPDRYVLFVGTIYPFKNIETVISAFGFAKKHGKLPHKLVLVGGESSAYGNSYRIKLEKQARELGLNKDILWIGQVSDDLPQIYSMADVFVFPSLYESFGLPCIEAMACGVPTIVSDAGALPEVVEDAAIIQKSDDVEGIGVSLIKILNSEELRQKLIKKGLERSRNNFSWGKCATETLAAYEKIYYGNNK